MKKAIVISSIALLVLACAFIYANSPRSNSEPVVSMTSDSTQVKPCEQKSDSTICKQHQHKCQKQDCKKTDKPCCKKN